jgi:hypothetical protein
MIGSVIGLLYGLSSICMRGYILSFFLGVNLYVLRREPAAFLSEQAEASQAGAGPATNHVVYESCLCRNTMNHAVLSVGPFSMTRLTIYNARSRRCPSPFAPRLALPCTRVA